jgi:hypothetical protein
MPPPFDYTLKHLFYLLSPAQITALRQKRQQKSPFRPLQFPAKITKTTIIIFREFTMTLPSPMASYSEEMKDVAFGLLGASAPVSKQSWEA